MRTMTIVALLALIPAGAAADGAAMFRTRCTPCHGADGSAQTPAGKAMKARDLRSADIQKLTDEQMTKSLTDGKGKMPASKLSATDMKLVIAFVRTLKN